MLDDPVRRAWDGVGACICFDAVMEGAAVFFVCLGGPVSGDNPKHAAIKREVGPRAQAEAGGVVGPMEERSTEEGPT